MFRDLWEDLTRPHDLVEGILLLLMWILVLGLLFLIGWGILAAIDYLWRPIHEGQGIVVDKNFIPAHYTWISTYNAALKISTLTPIYHPNEWQLIIKVNNLTDDFSVSERVYNSININKVLNVEYSLGRIWHTLYIKTINI